MQLSSLCFHWKGILWSFHEGTCPTFPIFNLSHLDDEIAAALMKTATRVARVLRVATACEGVNLVLSDGAAAGQDVSHLHLHVKPRWTGDDVMLRWDTATAPEAERARLGKVISDHLTG
ncbi:HIT family protein [Limimaricola sp. AA108-03]|uniref:HIT family protein n=1 Tax=Limimaricola sp. AA108-03 TaxID=3425945 RepID=UPI003D782ADD